MLDLANPAASVTTTQLCPGASKANGCDRVPIKKLHLQNQAARLFLDPRDSPPLYILSYLKIHFKLNEQQRIYSSSLCGCTF